MPDIIAEVQLCVSSQSSNVSALSQHQKAESILIQFLLVCLLGNFNKKKNQEKQTCTESEVFKDSL